MAEQSKKISKLLNTIIMVLLVIALVLVYLIVTKNGNLPDFLKSRPATTSVSRVPGATGSAIPKSPAQGASKDEQMKYFQNAATMAKNADALDITKCSPAPTVIRVKLGQAVKVKNQDTTSHTISLNSQKSYPIPANSTKEITDVFANGVGAYGYRCDNSSAPVGIILAVSR